jgi:head-tail adaptor
MARRLVPITAWPYIDPGKKRHKIDIQAQSSIQDTFGQQINTWSTTLCCYAAIETISTKEQFQDGFVSQVVHMISIDWPRGISILANMRVIVHPIAGPNANVFEIQAVENVQQRNLVVRLTCLEINNATVASA